MLGALTDGFYFDAAHKDAELLDLVLQHLPSKNYLKNVATEEFNDVDRPPSSETLYAESDQISFVSAQVRCRPE
jgi:hypothetical protein